MGKLEKNEDYQQYLNLSPTSEATNIDEYSEAMDYALKNDDILNIAVFGGYGSGKTSFLKTYFNKNRKYKKINISLGSYNEGNEDRNDNIPRRNINEYHQSIEKSILQQLLYQTDEKSVPLSRFKRLSVYSKKDFFKKTTLLFGAVFILFGSIFPSLFTRIVETIKLTNSILSSLNFKIFDYIIHIDYILTGIIYSLAFIIILLFNFKILEFLKNNIYISKFKFKDAEIEITNKRESIFNKYLDEIIYFFQCTDFDTVIFEDLDRFSDAIFIIEKLKELNCLINASTKIGRRIKFIFAIKDDIFKSSRERTKFFDKIIPIIPISSYSNSNEIIWEKFEKIYGKHDKYYEIDKEFINNISVFIDDMRIINNIMSDFVIYSENFMNKNLDNKNLFAMLVYKNLFPKGYLDLLNDKGVFPYAFKNVKNGIAEIIQNITENKNDIAKKIENARKEKLSSIRELKGALISDTVNFQGNINNQYFKFDNSDVKINEFYNGNFDMTRISREKVTFKDDTHYQNIIKQEVDLFNKFGGKEMFIERINNINAGTKVILDDLQTKTKQLENDIQKISELPLNKLANIYGIEHFSKTENDLEIFMIKRGYVTNDYYDYISLFKEGNLTLSDMIFVKNVKKNNSTTYNYNLKNIREVMERLDLFDFSSTYIFNFDLFDYIFENAQAYLKYVDKISSLFENIDEVRLSYIDGYEKSGNNYNKFLNILINKSNNLWSYIYSKKIGDNNYIDKWIVYFLNSGFALGKTDDNFIKYINNHMFFGNLYLKINKDAIDLLLKLKIKFSSLDNNKNNEQFLNIVYENNLYEINDSMLKLMLQTNDISYEKYEEEFLTILFSNAKLSKMKDYILPLFEEYIKKCYINKNTLSNSQETIINLLNNDLIDQNLKKIIIQNEQNKLDNINVVDIKLYDDLILNKKISINWNNIIILYLYKGEINDVVASYINQTTEKLNKENLNALTDNYGDDALNIEHDFVFSDKISYKVFHDNIDAFGLIIEELTNDITDEKLRLLIEKGMIVFNENNFNYVKNNKFNILFTFINLNSQAYIENINQFDISGKINEMMTSQVLKEDVKKALIEQNIVDSTKLNDNILYGLAISNKYNIRNESVDKHLLLSSINKDSKIRYLKAIKPSLTNDKLIDYIKSIDDDYSKICSEKNIVNIEFNEDVYDMLKYMESCNLISSCKKGQKNNILVYNNRIS